MRWFFSLYRCFNFRSLIYCSHLLYITVTYLGLFYLIAKKQHNGAVLRTNSLKSCTRSPPLERKSKLSALGRFFKPWKWRRKKKSEKFEEASKCKVQCFWKILAILNDFFKYILQLWSGRFLSVPIEKYWFKRVFYFQKVQ